MSNGEKGLTSHFDGAKDRKMPLISFDKINTKGWGQKALDDLEAAKNGASWAIQNLAHYSANGLYGIDVNLENARLFAEQAKALGNKLSIGFLKDLDKIVPKNVDTTLFYAEGENAGKPVPKDTILKDVKNDIIDNSDIIVSAEKSADAKILENAAKYYFDTKGWDDWAKRQLEFARAGHEPSMDLLKQYAENGGFHGVTKESLNPIPASNLCTVFRDAKDPTRVNSSSIICENPKTMISGKGGYVEINIPELEKNKIIYNGTGKPMELSEIMYYAVRHKQIAMQAPESTSEDAPQNEDESPNIIQSMLSIF